MLRWRSVALAVSLGTSATAADPAPRSDAAYRLVLRDTTNLATVPMRTLLANNKQRILQEVTAAVDGAPSDDSRACATIVITPPDAVYRPIRATSLEDISNELQQRGVTISGEFLSCTLEECQRLSSALRRHDDAAATVHISTLLRLVVDASVGTCPAQKRDCPRNLDVVFGSRETPRRLDRHRTLRDRALHQLVLRNDRRLDTVQGVGDGPSGRAQHPSTVLWTFIGVGHDVTATLARWDDACMNRFGISDVVSFAAHEDTFYRCLADHTLGLVHGRLSDAARAIRLLVEWAWVHSGRADSVDREAQGRRSKSPPVESKSDEAVPPPDSAAQTAATFVGSRNSAVYHHTSCAHAARIKQENLVRFSSPVEAKNAGRRACRTCKPE